MAKTLILLTTTVYLATQINGQFGVYSPPKPEGESCGTLGEEEWTCQKESDCDVYKVMATVGNIVTCSENEGEKIRCCPSKKKPRIDTPISISERKCLEYRNRLCSNNDEGTDLFRAAFSEETNSKETEGNANYEEDSEDSDTGTVTVVNGKEATARQIPYVALIGYGTPPIWKCGGSVISENFVLSAAHCDNDPMLGEAKWVRLGELDYKYDNDSTIPQNFMIVERFVHPDYKVDGIYSDIALFRLDKNAIFNEYVKPVCLHPGLPDSPRTVTASGWGFKEMHIKSSSLAYAHLDVLTNKECNSRYSKVKKSKELPSEINGTTILCTSSSEGKDTCQGDSGGPLVVRPTYHCLRDLLGVTAMGGEMCGDPELPTLNAKVSAYLPWIEKIVWPENES